ncbi:MAG: hypothetical protein H0W71_06420 [Sphingomonas sp.]|nr:hypothetical protein [Sphingomonas sp.]
MRILIAIPALLMLGACQVTKDDANDTTTVTYNGDVAENAAADVSATAQNVASDIGNGVNDAADKVKNTDVNVTVNDHDADDGNTAANR